MTPDQPKPSMVGSVLGQRIFWRSLWSIGVTCVLVMGVQAVLVVKLMQEQRLRTMETTVDLMLPNLANAAWQINDIRQWNGMMEDAMNAYVDLRRSEGKRPFIDGPHFEIA